MKKDKFLSVMGELDEKYIAEYQKATKLQKRKLAMRITAVAACLCLVIGAVAVAVPLLQGGGENNVIEGGDNAVTAPTEGAPEPAGPFKMLNVTAEKTVGSYISCDTDFLVHTENGSENRVREHLYISGGPEYSVTKEEEEVYRVSLQGNLAAGSNLSLSYAKDGATEYSWAFEAERKLEVVSTTPYNNQQEAKKDAPITIELSMAGGQSIAHYVTFTPKIEGRWENIGTLHRFIPYEPLKADTVYTVTVAPGYKVGEYTMEGYSFSFNTGLTKRNTAPSPNFRGLLYFKPTEQVVLQRYIAEKDNVSDRKVKLYTFADPEGFVNYLNSRGEGLPLNVSTPTFTVTANSGREDIAIGTLAEGYYLAEIEATGAVNTITYAPICVTKIGAYAAVTERDLVVWADDEGIRVSAGGKEAFTNNNGIAHLKDVTEGTDKAGIIYLGDKAQPLVFAAPQYTHTNYPYCYLYCDKPLYKTSDTVHFFGVVPTGLFYDGAKGDFTITFCPSGKETRKITVTPDADGTFRGEISYTDIAEGYSYLQLHYQDTYLTSRSFNIEDYYLQNYIYQTNSEKIYTTVGGTFDFTVSVEHLSGVKVSGKTLRAEINNVRHFATTDQEGVAHFSIPAPINELDTYGNNGNSQLQRNYIYIYGETVEGEDSYNSVALVNYWLVREEKDIDMIYTPGNLRQNDKVFRGVYLRADKVSDKHADYEDFYEYGAPFDITVRVYLTTYERQRTGTSVDPNTGMTEYNYTDDTSSQVLIDTIAEYGGSEYVFKPSKYTLPEASETKKYSLEAEYEIKLGEGNTEYGTLYLNSNAYKSLNNSTPPAEDIGIIDYSSDTTSDFNSAENHLYRYGAKGGEGTYRVGETVPMYIYDTVKGEKVTEGLLLRIIYRNGIMATELVDVKDAAFTYKEEYGPFVMVTYALHRDSKFYRLPAYQITQNTQERTITVTQTTDKEFYRPGETVTVKVKTTNEAGNGIPCTVNVSVVNEAVFAAMPHGTYIDNILMGKHYPMYSFSTFYDRELYVFEGGYGGGGGDDPRINFADTATFTTLKTDEKGEAQVTFTLPDSVTEYRITTHAASGRLMYGVSESKFKVKKEFFMITSAPRGQKYTDDFVAYVTTVGNGGEASFTFSLKETGQVIEATAPVGSAATANFGKLPAGTYTLCVEGTCGELKDKIEYPIEVTAGSMTNAYTETPAPDTPVTITPSAFPVKVEISTPEAEKYASYFSYLASSPRTRLDNAVSAYLSGGLYNQLMGTEQGEGYYTINSDFVTDDHYMYSMYSEGGNDYALTALTFFFAPKFSRFCYPEESVSADNYIRKNMIKAAEGTASLNEIKNTEQFGEGDEQLRTMIALSYIFMGDYDSAARIYATLPERSNTLGVDGMRAIIATFVDRENAASVIDGLLAEEPDEFYLNFAVLSFLKNRVDSIGAESTVTLTVNGKTTEHTVNGIQKKTLYIENDGTNSITAGYNTKGEACVKLIYTDYEKAPETSNFEIYLEGSLTHNLVTYLVIDSSDFYGMKNITLSLPPSLRVCESFSSTEKHVYGSAKHENVSVFTDKEHSGKIRIPLLVTQSGNYTIEPVRLTNQDGQSYYSNQLNFSAN